MIRNPDQTWQWIQVESYQRVDYHESDFFALLWGEILLAVISGLLIVVVLGLKIDWSSSQSRPPGRYTPRLSGLALLTTMFVLPPALIYGYSEALTVVAIIFAFLLLLPLSVETSMHLENNSDLMKKLLLLRGRGHRSCLLCRT